MKVINSIKGKRVEITTKKDLEKCLITAIEHFIEIKIMKEDKKFVINKRGKQ